MATISPPLGVNYTAIDETSVRLRWRPIPEATGYVLRGGGSTIERTVTDTEAVIRGLIPAVHSLMEIKSINADGESVWVSFDVRPKAAIPPAPADTPIVPLIDADRQFIQLRLPRVDGSNVDVRLQVWWQPSDAGWWASIEIPVNSPTISSKRLGVNCGLFDDDPGWLAGNIVMRSTSDDMEVEPLRNAFRDQTHLLRWEADGG